MAPTNEEPPRSIVPGVFWDIKRNAVSRAAERESSKYDGGNHDEEDRRECSDKNKDRGGDDDDGDDANE